MQRREFLRYIGFTSFLLASGHVLFAKLLPDASLVFQPPDVAQAIEKAIKAGFGEAFACYLLKTVIAKSTQKSNIWKTVTPSRRAICLSGRLSRRVFPDICRIRRSFF